MKLSWLVVATVSILFSDSLSIVRGQCTLDPLENHLNVGLNVERVGSVPTNRTDSFSYNMFPADNFDNALYFIDQREGIIYSYDDMSSNVTKIYDIAENEVPAGLTLDYSDYPFTSNAAINKIHTMVQGRTSDEVYIVFSSITMPEGYTEADAKLPAEGTFPGYLCGGDDALFVRDLYRIGPVPPCYAYYPAPTFTIYPSFYRYTLLDGQLVNPEPFFVIENQIAFGHVGGGIATTNSGNVLYSTGDCLPAGSDGWYAPQLDDESCGKILLINPRDSSYEVVAKGVRNSQQFRVVRRRSNNIRKLEEDTFITAAPGNETELQRQWRRNRYLVFMDIGGVTAEEVNAVSMRELLNRDSIQNFGWGRNLNDGLNREGTFYIGPGEAGILGGQPPCEGDSPVPEEGYMQPWVQFGRSPEQPFFAISSFAVDAMSFNSLELIRSEFNTGVIFGTRTPFATNSNQYTGPARSYIIRLFQDGVELEMSLNDLVRQELGEVGYYRGDPRLFHFPDGTAGVLIERTGVFYRLQEIYLPH